MRTRRHKIALNGRSDVRRVATAATSTLLHPTLLLDPSPCPSARLLVMRLFVMRVCLCALRAQVQVFTPGHPHLPFFHRIKMALESISKYAADPLCHASSTRSFRKCPKCTPSCLHGSGAA